MESKSVFVLMPFQAEFDDVHHAIREAANRAEGQANTSFDVFRVNEKITSGSIVETVKDHLTSSDLIIADITDGNPNVLFELGYAEAAGRPVILISQRDAPIPFNVSDRRVRLYDRARLRELVVHLADDITIGANQPESFIRDSDKRETPAKVPSAFVSYSHADSEHLGRLQVHLRPLVKKGKIDVWVDTKIKAGDRWKEAIESALEDAVIAVLLISADFLASDFIVDNELPPILEGAEKKGTRILPIILGPCRFARDEHLSRFQALNSPDDPLLLMDKHEQERAWDQLAREVELELDSRAS